MGEAFITRRGGSGGAAGLNFEIIGGASQPSAPKENTIWVNTSQEITSWDFSAEQPFYRSRNKNFITYPFEYTTRTQLGVTFTDNGDGTITASGTATADAAFRLSFVTAKAMAMLLPPGSYFLSGCPAGGAENTYRLEVKSFTDESTLAVDIGQGAAFTIDKTHIARANIVVASGTTVSGFTFSPQLEKGNAATSFQKGDATGQVWLQTGSASATEFNALKKNGLQVYPVAAKQYIDGEWVDKAAKSFQGGEWVDWWIPGTLFANGTDDTDLTGGWKSSAYSAGSGYTEKTVSVDISSDGIGATLAGTGYHSTFIGTKNKVDVSGYNTLKMEFSEAARTNTQGAIKLQLYSDAGYTTAASTNIISTDGAVNLSPEIDVSALSGKYYIGWFMWTWGTCTLSAKMTTARLS